MNRYIRQTLVPQVGETGQKKLAKARVLVVGAGGLGCPVLSYLAGAGIGQITIVDPDHVEESNLHRQPLYTMTDIGRPKAEMARDHVLRANPKLTLTAHAAALHPKNAAQFVQNADIVIDAADSFAVSYILSDLCFQAKTPLISASALGQTGYVGAFCGKSTPSLRAVFPDLPQSGATCATSGVLGPVVGMIGALQAQMALQIVMQMTPSPMGRLVTLDAASLTFGGFDFTSADEPKTHAPFISLADIDPLDYVIELRDEHESQHALHPMAQRLGGEALEQHCIPAQRRVVLCCATGLRAWRASDLLRSRGYDATALIAASACQ
ncbi:molybdopterin/thiamine biosynthesis adenylyltransferase [Pacificibacter maritimus]|uniref:Molybdopterin/thiamine biosynthesis adenylyltransferase n=1 Tax=Pacificibacter maritimus TaxID=762213 RepID=A0A3N4UNC2_9RHOB|nr:HesA/MoeB/ThiF family protein [Pacificibacter maritimus]RPE71518.1 molybdopterin/thiamine biosynthesis adenylyltransferase [Pacificibacter maritimus]